MKIQNFAFGGALIVSAHSVKADQTIIVNNLNLYGFSFSNINEKFSSTLGITLNPNEFLRVTADEEGKNFNFETMDHLCIVIDANSALGIGNKDLKK